MHVPFFYNRNTLTSFQLLAVPRFYFCSCNLILDPAAVNLDVTELVPWRTWLWTKAKIFTNWDEVHEFVIIWCFPILNLLNSSNLDNTKFSEIKTPVGFDLTTSWSWVHCTMHYATEAITSGRLRKQNVRLWRTVGLWLSISETRSATFSQ